MTALESNKEGSGFAPQALIIIAQIIFEELLTVHKGESCRRAIVNSAEGRELH